MDRSEIRAKLQDILLLALGADAEKMVKDCTDDSNLATDLGLNSVGVLYVVIGIEEMFSISFGDVSFGDFKTVGDVINYIETKVN